METDLLSPRQETILKLLIGEYVDSAVPVGSETLVRKYALGVSSATIRHELADLEEQDYITHPHTSAGRVPSDKGYRYFVEYLLDEVELNVAERRMIEHQFYQVEADWEEWTRLAAAVLARLLQNAAVVTMPTARPVRLVRLQLVEVREHTALLVLVFQPALLREQLINFADPIDQPRLTRISNHLSQLLRGLSAAGIREQLAGLSGEEATVAAAVIRWMQASDRQLAEDLTLDGLRHMLAQPEFIRSERTKRVVEALEERSRLIQLLGQALEGSGTQVLIGAENALDAIRECTLILSRYGAPDELHGVLGVVGPTRLDYGRSIAAVRFLSGLLSEILTEKYS